MEEKQLIDHWKELIKSIFPLDTQFEGGKEGYTIYINIRWKLKNDPNRPNKPSKIIKLVIPFEYIEDNYFNRDNERQRKIDHNLRNFVEERFKIFNPNHEHSKLKGPPTEEWLVPEVIFYQKKGV